MFENKETGEFAVILYNIIPDCEALELADGSTKDGPFIMIGPKSSCDAPVMRHISDYLKDKAAKSSPVPPAPGH